MSIQVENLEGIYPAIITPMGSGKEIDYLKLDKLIEDLISGGIAGICACGTTGQSATLNHDEHINLAVYIKQRIKGRCQFIAAAGSNSTREALQMTRKLETALGPTTFLHVTGYYNNPPQEGLITHFETLADSLENEGSNIILYNVPSRTCSNITSETTIKLAQHSKIIGTKEASGDLKQIDKIIKETDSTNFRVLSGECDQIAEIVKMGGFGSISATANIAPKLIVELTKYALSGEHEKASQLQERAMQAIEATFIVKNPIPLAMMFGSSIRLPMVILEDAREAINKLLSNYTKEELGIDLSEY